MSKEIQIANAFKLLRILHLALLLGMTGFAIISLAVHRDDLSLERTLQVVCVTVSLVSIVVGFNIFKRNIMAARNSAEPGPSRMVRYKRACLTWWAMIEIPGLLASVAYVVTGAYAFFALALFHIVIMLAFTPRKDNIVVLLNLTSKEVDQLEGKA